MKLVKEVRSLTSKPSDYKQYLDFGFNLLQNIDGIYDSAITTLIKQILCPVFAEKLIFEGKDYRTSAYHEALLLILNAIKSFGENKKGQTAFKNNLSFLVVPMVLLPNQILEDLKTIGDFR